MKLISIISKRAILVVSVLLCSLTGLIGQSEEKYKEALDHIASLDKHKAADIFNEILEKDPNHSPSIYQLGILEMEFGETESAVKRFKKVISLNKDFTSNAYFSISKINLEKGNSEEAFKQLNTAIEKDSSLFEAYFQRCKIHYKLKNYSQALSDINKAISLNDKDPDYFYNRGLIKVETDKYDEAIEDFSKVISQNKNIENAYFFRGYCYYKKGTNEKENHHRDNLNKALADYNTCLVLEKDDELAYFNRAETHMALARLTTGGNHHYIDAISDFKSAIELNPNNKEAHYNKAICNYKYGYEDQALAELESILAMDPNYKDALYQVALIKYEYQEFNTALELYNRLIELEDDHADAFIYRGYTNFELKKKKEACLDWKKADELGDKEAHKDLKKYCKKYVDLDKLENKEQ